MATAVTQIDLVDINRNKTDGVTTGSLVGHKASIDDVLLALVKEYQLAKKENDLARIRLN